MGRLLLRPGVEPGGAGLAGGQARPIRGVRIWIPEGLTRADSRLEGVDFPWTSWIPPKSRLWNLRPVDS